MRCVRMGLRVQHCVDSMRILLRKNFFARFSFLLLSVLGAKKVQTTSVQVKNSVFLGVQSIDNLYARQGVKLPAGLIGQAQIDQANREVAAVKQTTGIGGRPFGLNVHNMPTIDEMAGCIADVTLKKTFKDTLESWVLKDSTDAAFPDADKAQGTLLKNAKIQYNGVELSWHAFKSETNVNKGLNGLDLSAQDTLNDIQAEITAKGLAAAGSEAAQKLARFVQAAKDEYTAALADYNTTRTDHRLPAHIIYSILAVCNGAYSGGNLTGMHGGGVQALFSTLAQGLSQEDKTKLIRLAKQRGFVGQLFPETYVVQVVVNQARIRQGSADVVLACGKGSDRLRDALSTLGFSDAVGLNWDARGCPHAHGKTITVDHDPRQMPDVVASYTDVNFWNAFEDGAITSLVCEDCRGFFEAGNLGVGTFLGQAGKTQADLEDLARLIKQKMRAANPKIAIRGGGASPEVCTAFTNAGFNVT